MYCYFLLLYALYRIFIYLRFNFLLKLNGEDKYHDNLDKSSKIISKTKFNIDRFKWYFYLKNLEKNLILFYRQELSKELCYVNDNNIIIKNENNGFFEGNEIIYTIIEEKSQTITTYFNHRYCGGYFFLKYAAIITDGNVPELLNTPSFIIQDVSLLKFLLVRPDLKKTKEFKLIEDKDKIKRISFMLDKKLKPEDVNTKVWLMKTCLDYIQNCYNNDIKLIIPVPLEYNKNIKNNIGVCFLNYPKNGYSFNELKKELNKIKYQIIATNYFLKLRTNPKFGKKTRNSVNIVFTMGYVYNSRYVPENSIVSYNNIADYGIYLNIFSSNDKFFCTITLCTDCINSYELSKSIPNSKIIDI